MLINLQTGKGKEFLTGPMIKKVCKYWTYFGTEACHQKIEKPIRPSFQVKKGGAKFDPKEGSPKADLYLMVPAWYARFCYTEFPDRESVC